MNAPAFSIIIHRRLDIIYYLCLYFCMPPLEHKPHEKFARAVVDLPSNTQAYQKVYGVNAESAAKHAPRVFARPEVKSRINELLDKKGVTDELLAETHYHLLTNGKDVVKARALELGYKVKGAIEPDQVKVAIGVGVLYEPERRARMEEFIATYANKANLLPPNTITPV